MTRNSRSDSARGSSKRLLCPDVVERYSFVGRIAQLREVEGVRVFETKTNYMLCELENATATDLKYHLIHEHGMLIRDCSNFYGLDNHFFRVSAQLPEENDALVAAIRDYLEALEK